VERALAGNADSVELEPVPEGLEVCWRVGNTGLGRWSAIRKGIGLLGLLYLRPAWNDMIKA
jgi:hypothetical protein